MSERINFNAIQPDEAIPSISKKMTQEIINKWADAVGDYNPLHVDPEYAKKTKFKSTIAHGPLVISYISEMMSNWLKDGWIEGGKLLDIKFNAPVKSGDVMKVGGQVKEKRTVENQKIVECDVYIENQEGVKVVVGRAIGLVA
jgi:3-hydroxybutyryl-CoA dehydratase